MTTKGDFQPAAQNGAMQGGDDWNRHVFKGDDHIGQQGRAGRLIKFGNVSPGNECFAAA